jgi:hypothetical protein
MRRRLGLALTVLTLISATALPALAKQQYTVDAWCDGDGIKIELEASEWTSDAYYDLVVVKAGTVSTEYFNVSPGDTLYGAMNRGGQQADISHIILCYPDDIIGG